MKLEQAWEQWLVAICPLGIGESLPQNLYTNIVTVNHLVQARATLSPMTSYHVIEEGLESIP